MSAPFPLTGVCYYPEHWPDDQWPDDAERMVKAGIRQVRLAEFSWSRTEPERGRFDWSWLDKAVGVLAGAGHPDHTPAYQAFHQQAISAVLR